MCLVMAEPTIKHPIRILYHVLVKIEKFIFHVKFVIFNTEVNAEVPIILGRSFLATGRALIDMENKKVKFLVNGKEIVFNVCKSMKQLSDPQVLSAIDMV